MKIKIYGERNCGTNYLEQLLILNFDVEIIKYRPNSWGKFLLKTIPWDFIQDFLWILDTKYSLGWKHACPPIKALKNQDPEGLLVITISKNPFSFLLSLYRRPYHIKGKNADSFSEFIRQEWICRRRDLSKNRRLQSPIDLWNLKNKSYQKLKEGINATVINLRYEDLIKNPEACLKSIAEKGKIQGEFTRSNAFKNQLISTNQSSSGFEEYQKYYLKEEWRKEISKADMDYIASKLDHQVLQYFKYNCD